MRSTSPGRRAHCHGHFSPGCDSNSSLRRAGNDAAIRLSSLRVPSPQVFSSWPASASISRIATAFLRPFRIRLLQIAAAALITRDLFRHPDRFIFSASCTRSPWQACSASPSCDSGRPAPSPDGTAAPHFLRAPSSIHHRYGGSASRPVRFVITCRCFG